MKIFLPVFLAILAAGGVIWGIYAIKQGTEERHRAAQAAIVEQAKWIEQVADLTRTGDWVDDNSLYPIVEYAADTVLKKAPDRLSLFELSHFTSYTRDVLAYLVKRHPERAIWAAKLEETLKAIDAIRDQG